MEYTLNDVDKIWLSIKEYFNNQLNTPFLITDYDIKYKTHIFKVYEETKTNQEYNIFDENKIILYPTSLQKIYFSNKSDEEKITELLSRINRELARPIFYR